ncbi:hypothetical protein [Lysobacter gummosus]
MRARESQKHSRLRRLPSPQPSPAPRRKSPWVASGRGRRRLSRW